MNVTPDIHADIADMMQDAAKREASSNSASTKGWTEEQLNSLNILLQFAWNRGYKHGYQEGFDEASENGSEPCAESKTYQPSLHEKAPYFECTAEQWERHTKGMTASGKHALANLLAHHCLLVRRDNFGWIVTRFDLINSGKPFWHVSNDGVLTYDYAAILGATHE